MSAAAPIPGVFLTGRAGMEAAYRAVDEPRLRLLTPDEVEDPAAIRFALCFRPPDDAFRPYPGLALIQTVGAGVDAVLDCPSLPPDVPVARARDDGQAAQMAATAVWHVVTHHRGMLAQIEAAREGVWRRGRRGGPVADWPVGVLGGGLMGGAAARALAGLGYPVTVATRGGGDFGAGIEVLSGDDAIGRTAERSRVLVNLLPLTAATREALNGALFARAPRGAVLVHLGRGEHLAETDVLEALDAGRLSAASLDAFATEPLPPEHPFWRRPEILVTPHSAAETDARTVVRQLGDAVEAVLAGRRPGNLVDRAAGY